MNDSLFTALQRLTPQRALSRAAGWLADCEIPLVKDTFISWFVKHYNVDMTQAIQTDPHAYPSFNAFFTRAMHDNARPIDQTPGSIICPADGTLSQLGKINAGRIFQAKGHSFSVNELLGDDPQAAEAYQSGDFATIYLSPRDYHRVHIPTQGTLRQMVHVPGKLFSVNKATTEHVPRLFARNERLVCHFTTERGPMIVVLVGAMIVASIETVWAGVVTPIKRAVRTTDYSSDRKEWRFAKGDEIGRFFLGSTVVLLFPEGRVRWQEKLDPDITVRMGEVLAEYID